jgi:predicted ferric reductase
VLAVIHVLFAGYYINEPWKRGLWTVITVSWVALLVYVRIVKPLRMLKHPWRIASVQPESGNAWTVTVVPEGHAGMAFLPGQFAWLTVARSPFSLSEHPFSIASSAAPGGPLEFTIKELGDFTRTIKNIQPNTRAYLDGPYGAFTTDYFPDAAGFVFVAGGVGIAPIMSMLRTLAVRKDPRPMWLFYGNRVWEGVIFRDEIESLREVLSLQVVHVLQEPPPEWAGETGLLNAALFRRLLPPAAFAFEVFVCGPKPMLSLVERALHTAGMPLTRIHSELFDLA